MDLNSPRGRRLRIGLDGSLACSKRPTGVEHFARSLLHELLRVEAPDLEWFLYLPPYGDPGTEVPPGVRVRYRPDVNTLIKTPWLVAQTWRDRLDAMYAFGHCLPGGCRGKVVLTVHDTAFDDYPDCYPEGVAVRAHDSVVHTCRQAARIAVPSQATRHNLETTYSYPADRIDVLLEGARPVFQPGAPGSLPQRVLDAGITEPFLLSVGRIDRRKNVARVIEAYRMLVEQGVPCGGLVIAGPDDHGSAEVRERLAGGKVPGECVVFTGYVEEAELVALYRTAAAVVYPSFAEGFGLPVLEAMACGAPVITSNVSSLPEVAGDAGLLVDPSDLGEIAGAMRRLLTDPDLRGTLAGAGLRRASEFSWRQSAERLTDCFRRTATGKAPAPQYAR
ncbi:MAG: mshA 6 [Armatimonadetes bacterium]|nr:mshA 6 [Armatimonadota bacterium]